MARNVEIKLRLDEFEEARRCVEMHADGPGELLIQEDTFFHVPKGRLKLRCLSDGVGELIAYHRTDDDGPALSDYRILRTENPQGLRSFLTDALGVRGVVRKRRWLYHIGRTRVHLDEVESLGGFLELEVVLADEEAESDGVAVAHAILHRLGLEAAKRIDCAYMDLLDRTT